MGTRLLSYSLLHIFFHKTWPYEVNHGETLTSIGSKLHKYQGIFYFQIWLWIIKGMENEKKMVLLY